MINYVECFQYYQQLLQVSDEHTTHSIVQWYQEKCGFYNLTKEEIDFDTFWSSIFDNTKWITFNFNKD